VGVEIPVEACLQEVVVVDGVLRVRGKHASSIRRLYPLKL
jgi:hypothetical protein